jgi:hypothetical protein
LTSFRTRNNREGKKDSVANRSKQEEGGCEERKERAKDNDERSK